MSNATSCELCVSVLVKHLCQWVQFFASAGSYSVHPSSLLLLTMDYESAETVEKHTFLQYNEQIVTITRRYQI